jgi:feruloyl esterase
VKHSYFEGCSNGGRQAMMMAQNYPELFDGIVAGAPSQWYPDLLMWLLWTGKTLTPSAPFGPPSISTAKRASITQRALQACDANDGLVDGQITNPRTCTFDIDTMGPVRRRHAQRRRGDDRQADVWRHASELGRPDLRAALHRREVRFRGGLVAAVRRQRRLRPIHRSLRLLAAVAAYDWRRDINWDDVYDHAKAVLTPVTAAPSPDIRRSRAAAAS